MSYHRAVSGDHPSPAAAEKPVREVKAHVERAFFRDGRLAMLPARRSFRLAALERLAARFEIGRRYAEREVNAVLADDAPDHATLRRLLVDEGFLRRAAGEYWRQAPGS
jgi:hypothetical protein